MHPASRGLLAVSSTQFAHLLWPVVALPAAAEGTKGRLGLASVLRAR